MKPKLILVSGGSRGLGYHIVKHLLDAGHAVGSFARKRTVQVVELETRHTGRFHFIESDASDLKTLGRFMGELIEQHGELHGLVNNAAVGQDHLLVHASPDKIHSIIATNLEAPILLTRLALKQMLLQEGGGRIVNISSICGLRGYTGLTVYSATKAGMDAFTRCLAHEVSGRGILVNSIAPGFFESEMSSVLSPDQLAIIKRRTPTHNLTSDDNLTPVLDMLLFADANMTGQTIVVDGGTSC
jgi:3-oxoacyl-[acyl-carrier protein] reductase|uniref:SDR family NAD(P)-dependent oxidoreductase n=1 Tax=Prosthecobacter sp. TaxID=1965333 RepID=UPI00378325D8